MQPVDWIYAFAALASGIAAVAAWIAKIRWSQEYSAAKEAQIDVLKERIVSLEKLTPMKIQEYFVSVTSQLEGFVDRLKVQLADAEKEVNERTQQIVVLETAGEAQKSKLEEVSAQKKEIEKTAAELQTQLDLAESAPQTVITIPQITPTSYNHLVQSSSALQVAMGEAPTIDVSKVDWVKVGDILDITVTGDIVVDEETTDVTSEQSEEGAADQEDSEEAEET